MIKAKYLNYSTRILKGLLPIAFVTSSCLAILFFFDLEKIEIYLLIGVWIIIMPLYCLSAFKINKRYLGEIKIDKDECEFQLYEYNKALETIHSKTSETRIKIIELFFPIAKSGRNYKLVIETKQGLTYKKIIEQYEIGDWDLKKFKECMKIYREVKFDNQ
ncbi:hypothetical protein BZG02_14230 [Labilibaculum filiforme]|uniref:Uncharacterized protein n=1 Tax=Labilibaculum filiforme TaxID=1940526 RepID=A0A2N3HVJ8_9BACT|nr:hypothetical protein [Labilibaculum filiforme]PKQ62084.1 hypothetical protein BZG02_14230 [Labilibaculum filiforme]